MAGARLIAASRIATTRLPAPEDRRHHTYLRARVPPTRSTAWRF